MVGVNMLYTPYAKVIYRTCRGGEYTNEFAMVMDKQRASSSLE
jgi:hypothetical protein